MITTNLDGTRSSLSFEEQLQYSTKKEIVEACRFFGFSVPQHLRKQEFIAVAARGFLTHVDYWISLLSKDEALLLQKLVEAGPNVYVTWPVGLFQNVFEAYSFLLVDESEVDQGLQRYMICDELREAIAPSLTSLFTPEKQQQWEIEQYMYGLLNLYGVISLPEMIIKLERIKKVTLSVDQLLSLIQSGSIRRFVFDWTNFYSTTTCIRSPFLYSEHVGEILELQQQHSQIGGYKVFTDEEIYEAGRLPYPLIAASYFQEVQSFFREKLKMSEVKMAYDLQRIWLGKQYGEDAMSAVLSMLSGKLDSMKELQSAIELFSGYTNAIPVWDLWGYSPDETNSVFETEGLPSAPPQIVAGPGMEALGMRIPAEMQAYIDEEYRNEVMPTHKVGRNDPCPCGSGKKYKRCCGMSH